MTLPSETGGAVTFLTAPVLLRDFHLRRATGQLSFHRGDALKKVYFRNGTIIFASSDQDADRLSDVLLAEGRITRAHYEESAKQVLATGRKQSTILVQIGAIAPRELFRGLIAQVREIVLSLAAWDDGTWRFLQGLPPEEEIVSLRLHPSSLVFEGLRRQAGDARFAALWNPAALVITAASAPPVPVEELDCPAAAKHLLTLVEEGRPWEEISHLAGHNEREAAALLYGLALFGAVETAPRAAATAAAPAAAAAPPAPAPAPEPAPAAASTAPDPETQKLRERVGTLAARLPSLTLYQLLGLTPETDKEAVKRSYLTLAREFHPDRFFRPGLEDLQEQANSVFMRINEAYTTLQNAAARAEYDRELVPESAPETREREPKQDSRLAEEQFRKGLAQLGAGDVWSAIQSFRWAVNLNPQSARYHSHLGVALTRTKKRLHEAEEHCKAAIALDYGNPQYYVHLGQVYRAGRLPDKARKQFEQALKLDPKQPQALKEIAELDGQPEGKGLLGKLFK